MLHPPRSYVNLDAMARTGSIGKAAEKLHVASTALNRKILELEQEIGTPLFERLPRGVGLTAAGELLVAAVRRGIAELFDLPTARVADNPGIRIRWFELYRVLRESAGRAVRHGRKVGATARRS